jgi:prepilin-type N-terminal cleavage/methylation domain-containing protein
MKTMNARRAYTLIELLVTIAIIGVLAALMIPAIQSSRDSARRNQCARNLARLAAALHRHEAAAGTFPSGVVDDAGPIADVPQGRHHGWLIALLPYLDEQNAYALVDPQRSVYDAANATVRDHPITLLRCPAQRVAALPPVSDYAGVHHDVEAPIDATNNGVLLLNRPIRVDDVFDGLAHTLLAGEMLFEPGDLGWMSGTRATLRNTGTPLNVTGVKPPPASGFTADQNLVAEDLYGRDFSFDDSAFDSGTTDEADSLGTGEPTAGPAANDKTEAENDAEERARAPAAFNNRPAAGVPPLYVGGFSSPHTAGVYFAFGDGRVQFLSDAIDPQLLRRLGHRADGQPREVYLK